MVHVILASSSRPNYKQKISAASPPRKIRDNLKLGLFLNFIFPNPTKIGLLKLFQLGFVRKFRFICWCLDKVSEGLIVYVPRVDIGE